MGHDMRSSALLFHSRSGEYSHDEAEKFFKGDDVLRYPLFTSSVMPINGTNAVQTPCMNGENVTDSVS